MGDTPDILKTIKDEWERRARSPNREFFVASHEGWDTDEGRERQARSDAAVFLTMIDPETTADQEILEIGCGSGRLVPYIAPLFRSYTGLDISGTMIEVARERSRSFRNARFFEADGVSIPEAARDRLYDYAFAAAVLIHCPKDICEALVAAAMKQLRVGGQLRIQMFADFNDPQGIIPGPDPDIVERAKRIESAATVDQNHLISGTHYEGHRFRYSEAHDWLDRVGQAHLIRFDPLHIYAIVNRVE